MNHAGWLLDLYEDEAGLVLWLMQEDGTRARLAQPFPVTLYAAGPGPRLRALWRWLRARPQPPRLERAERHELFAGRPLAVMAITAPGPLQARRLFAELAQSFPDLTYYDADLSPNLRHAARYGTFPLARVEIEASKQGVIGAVETRESPWALEHDPAPLRVMRLEPDCNPARAAPRALRIHLNQPALDWELPLEPARALLVNLAAMLRRYDPDLLLTAWGDTWLIPLLVELSRGANIPLGLSRDAGRGIGRKKERSYLTYGQVVHIGPQMRLFGRLHVDIYNAMMYHDYGMEGILESARVTALPIQTVARSSPGSGISAMQVTVALRREILVPWRKQAAEGRKSARDLIEGDMGGLVYAPILGLHSDVAELDFTSLYPACITTGHLSPELMNSGAPGAERVPGTSLTVDRSREGLVPATIEPLLQKRIALKARIAQMPAWDPRRAQFKAQAAAQKWLLVTCFGYLGYKNARFGRIEAHMATTACGREALMRAKETAEDLGFRVLGLYVDAVWVTRAGCRAPGDFQTLVEAITAATGLPITLDGVYNWLAFLPSRAHPARTVANRYFGAFQDGSLKVRGVEMRRADTPAFIAKTQKVLLEAMAPAGSAEALARQLPELVRLLRGSLRLLASGQVPPEELVVSQKLSRRLEEYRLPSPAAVAAAQLAEIGVHLQPGERVPLLFTRGAPGARAWHLPEAVRPETLDLERYRTLLVRAAWSVLGALGISEADLAAWAIHGASYRLDDAPAPCAAPPLLLEARRRKAELAQERLGRLLEAKKG